MENVTHYRILVTAYDVLPQLEFFITKPVEVKINETKIPITQFSSYSYKFSKLPHPYVDECIDYTLMGYRNRFDTISSCINSGMKKKNKYDYDITKIITRDMTDIFNRTIFDGTTQRPSGKCFQKYQNDDCNFELTYTDHENFESYTSSEFDIFVY